MRRKIVLFIIIAICFLLQTTVFRALTFANIGPNLLIIVVSSFGLMRGKKEGLWVGFFCGLLIDIFFGHFSYNAFLREVSSPSVSALTREPEKTTRKLCP